MGNLGLRRRLFSETRKRMTHSMIQKDNWGKIIGDPKKNRKIVVMIYNDIFRISKRIIKDIQWGVRKRT